MTKMIDVKIVWVQDVSFNDGYDDWTQTIVRHGISEWEQVTEQDYALLQRNLPLIAKGRSKGRPMLLVKDDQPIVTRIDSIKKQLQQWEKERLEAQQQHEQKRIDRITKKKAKDEMTELQLLESLKKKYPNG